MYTAVCTPHTCTPYNSTKAFVAPLLSGAGVKGKVNQAMKYGLPIVGTPIAFEAMHAKSMWWWWWCVLQQHTKSIQHKTTTQQVA